MKIAISSGHGTKIRGASGYSDETPWGVDEVDECIKIMGSVVEKLKAAGVEAVSFTDTVSTTQSENLDRIVDWHNAQWPDRNCDLSIHLNAYQSTTTKPMGTEVLYVNDKVKALAEQLSAAIAIAGHFVDRGEKKRTDLAFLNGTTAKSALIEVFFCDAKVDCDLYRQHFEAITSAIASFFSGRDLPESPSQPPAPPLEIPPPTIGFGDRGSSVCWVQMMLGLPFVPFNGDFDAGTEAAVENYQLRNDLSVDGVVGPATWAQLDADFDLPVYPPPALEPLPLAVCREICSTALSSELADYYWKDRGPSPAGYLQGMAFAYAVMVRKLKANDPVAVITAQADQRDPDHDALSWYIGPFEDHGMDNSKAGVETLRHLFVLLIGLGMRESSGRHCCGRDQSATNTTSDTCEAGLFQTSWNCSACSSDFDRLLDEYVNIPLSHQQTARWAFQEDVSCSASEWENYGSGVGYEYQELAKNAPQFAVETTALGLRYLRQHWGPINRFEVEIRPEADALLQDIETIIMAEIA